MTTAAPGLVDMDAVGEAEAAGGLGASTPGVVDTALLAGLAGLVGARAPLVLLSAHPVANAIAAVAMTAKHFIGHSLFRRPTGLKTVGCRGIAVQCYLLHRRFRANA